MIRKLKRRRLGPFVPKRVPFHREQNLGERLASSVRR